jgi:lipoate---protein ligase
MGSCEEKVPGGKLVRVSVSRDGVIVSGDFFIFPEEGVFQLEQALYSLNGDEPIDTIEAMLSRLVSEHDIKLIGLDEHVIARLYKGALDVASHRP